jgi:hypothetical protein
LDNETVDATLEKPTMDAEDDAAFVRLIIRLVDQHRLRTPEFIKRHITAFDAFGAADMADFWRDALTAYEQAYAMAETQLGGDRHLKIVS